ncbi:hypothetical protein QQF64_009350 [Cirrhinus molitorella]|uniref:Uncharacterized protein n=1 Tax=Cirrhinus molitorella TaxID=172907 RepID=A0ABR3M0X9_9TELE
MNTPHRPANVRVASCCAPINADPRPHDPAGARQRSRSAVLRKCSKLALDPYTLTSDASQCNAQSQQCMSHQRLGLGREAIRTSGVQWSRAAWSDEFERTHSAQMHVPPQLSVHCISQAGPVNIVTLNVTPASRCRCVTERCKHPAGGDLRATQSGLLLPQEEARLSASAITSAADLKSAACSLRWLSWDYKDWFWISA